MTTKFEAFDLSLMLIRTVRGTVEKIAGKDRDLEDQVRRAATSAPLNISEGNRRIGKDRVNRFRMAAGSADEVAAALMVAEAWGYVDVAEIQPTLEVCDRVLAILYKLTT